MASQTISTTFDPHEFKTLLTDCISEAIRTELDKVASNQSTEKTIYTRQETAALLGISLPTLNQYTKTGLIVGHRLGNKVRYRAESIEKALARIKTNRG